MPRPLLRASAAALLAVAASACLCAAPHGADAVTANVYSGSLLDVDISINMIHNFDVNKEISGSIGVEAHLSVRDHCGNSKALSLGQVSVSVADAFPGVDLFKCVWHGAELVDDVVTKIPRCLDTRSAVEALVHDLCLDGSCPRCPLQVVSDLDRLRGDIGACKSTIIDAADTLIDCSTALGKEEENAEGVALKDGAVYLKTAHAKVSTVGGGVYHNDQTDAGKKIHDNRVVAITAGVAGGVLVVAAAALVFSNRKLRRELREAKSDAGAGSAGYVEMQG